MGPSGLSRYTSDLPLALTPVLRVCPFGNRTQKKRVGVMVCTLRLIILPTD
jgi:hypothetical protein